MNLSFQPPEQDDPRDDDDRNTPAAQGGDAHTRNAPIGFTPHEASAWSVGYEEGRQAALAASPVEQQAMLSRPRWDDAGDAGHLPQPAAQAGAAEPVLYVSPGQLAAHTDPDHPEGGRYLPSRKTRAGLFTMPLYATTEQPSQDAERYRALRKSVGNPVYCAQSTQYGVRMIHSSAMDDACDELIAARAAQAQGEKGGAA